MSSRVCVGPFSCSAAGVSAFASVLGARSTCRALPASVVPCMSLDDSPMHDARDSRGAGGFLLVCKSTSYNLDCCSQGPTWRRGSKCGVSGLAEDLRSVSEVEAGVNFRPAGGVRGGQIAGHTFPPPGGSWYPIRVTGCGLDIRQSMGWTKVYAS